MKKFKLFLLANLISLTAISSAESSIQSAGIEFKQQSFSLNITSQSDRSDLVYENTCFRTTDVGSKVCGDPIKGTTGIYTKTGPKNWYLEVLDDKIQFTTDASCAPYFDKDNPQRSDDNDGSLNIYVTGNFNNGTMAYSNCSKVWNPGFGS